MTTSAPRKPGDTRIPRAAMQFDAGLLQFAEGDDQQNANEAPIKMLARTSQPITHWYWGRIVHDMAGMQLRKDSCPIDWCHDYGEILGVLNQFKATPKNGLEVSGKLVAFRDDDRAAEVMFKARAGVPYEASLDWSGPGTVIEEVGEGAKVKVNGYTFQGPGVVVRQWPLRAVALCPYGQDPGTKSQLADEASEEVEITLFSEDSTVSKTVPTQAPPVEATQQTETTSGTPANVTQQTEQTQKPVVVAAPAVPATEPKTFTAADLAKFVGKFGGENGAKWLSEGKSYEEALELHADLLGTQLKAKEGEVQQLSGRIEAAKTGEEKPVTFSDAEKPGADKQPALTNQLGGNIAKFAAGIKLPGAK